MEYANLNIVRSARLTSVLLSPEVLRNFIPYKRGSLLRRLMRLSSL